MKRQLFSAVAVLLTTVPPAAAQFFDGNELVDYCKNPNSSACIGYIMGSIDAQLEVPTGQLSTVCLPTDITASQAVAVVRKWLEENPQLWQLRGNQVVANALIGYFQCP